MNRIALAVAIFFGVISVAQARPHHGTHHKHHVQRHHHRHHHHHYRHTPARHSVRPELKCFIFCQEKSVPSFGAPTPLGERIQHHMDYREQATRMAGIVPRHHAIVGPRPRAWCGWYMQVDTGITSKATGRNLNRAIEWRHVGSPTSGPCEGCIGVWPHHVVRVVKVLPGGMILARSGNDSHRVKTRVRSARGAVAWRRI